ncbi:unnamed protein product [Allacma fusca]|uniref:RRM domain-containing protein n=1 Tax=Allacma fusca TaxID=39272 RepID=A0A8J2LFV8_9HEXA|nr:unnamed protein product [Allacma fusca]
MARTKWTKVTMRLGGKKFSVSRIVSNTKTSNNPKPIVVTNIVNKSKSIIQSNETPQTAPGKPIISEHRKTYDEDVKSISKCLSLTNNLLPEQNKPLHQSGPGCGCDGENVRQDKNELQQHSSSFMEQYKKVDLPSLQSVLSQRYIWPPTEQNLQVCKYYDDDSCSNGSLSSHGSPRHSSADVNKDKDANVFENILIVNIDGCTAVEDIREEFPTATRVYLENMTEINSTSLFSATAQFASVQEAQKKFQDSGLKKIGRKTLEWVRSNEIKIENLPPEVTKHELKRMFPPEIKRIELRTAHRQAIIRFRTGVQAAQAYSSSFLFPLGDRTLGWITTELRARMKTDTSLASLKNTYSGDSETDLEKTISEIDDDTIKTGVDELTCSCSKTNCNSPTTSGKIPGNRFSWQSPNYCKRNSMRMYYNNTTNISKIIMARPKVFVSRLPKNITMKTMRKIFPKALKIDMEDWKSGKLAVIEFDTTICAARACYDASRVKIGGRFIKVTPRKPHGFRRPRPENKIA